MRKLIPILAVFVAFAAYVGSSRIAADADPCSGRGSLLLVRTGAHELRLCDGGATAAVHRVALGRGGVDKRREGDERTPLGRYALARGRRSARFHRFFLVGYPTAAQRREGYTGSAIGVHGPSRESAAFGAASTWFDWTNGCIAVGSDEAIDAIAAWVERRDVDTIVIER